MSDGCLVPKLGREARAAAFDAGMGASGCWAAQSARNSLLSAFVLRFRVEVSKRCYDWFGQVSDEDAGVRARDQQALAIPPIVTPFR